MIRAMDAGPDPGDAAVLEQVLTDKRILVTMDKDFGALVHRDRLAYAGIIRLPHSTAAERIALIQQLLERHSEAALMGAIVAIRGTRIRILRGPG